jgi:exoribonuclease-2
MLSVRAGPATHRIRRIRLPRAMPPSPLIVEIREGGEVRCALALGEEKGRVTLLTADGREVRVAPARILHETGEPLPATDRARAAALMRAFDEEAERRADAIDLAELHAFLLAQAGEGEDVDLGDLDLRELAALALGDAGGRSRSAVHRALARQNPWFRFTGKGWEARSPEECARELERLERQRQLAQQREAFLAAARRRLSGDDAPLPAGCEKFFRPLREVALHGDAAATRKEAAALAAELGGGSSTLTQAAAFRLLHRLGQFGRDENLALLRAGVDEAFPPAVLDEAQELARTPWAGQDRLDLTGVEVVTIDDAKTREIDDGLSLESRNGRLRLGIHIADASHFVPAGSAVDAEALRRATSYYLPERSIAMLPPILAEEAASLVEGQERPALSFLVDLTPHGEILRTEVRPSVVRVARRMTYEDCERVLAGEDAGTPWLRTVGGLRDTLEQARLEAGATPMRTPEISITFDDLGEPVVTLVDPGRPARQLVSEMMILGNRIAALWCIERGLPAIFRRQAPSTSDAPPPPRDRHDPVAIDRFRRGLQRTEIGLEPGPHASLGLPAYVQATSPIRRYQDLAVHRLVKAACWGQATAHSREEMQAIAASTEQAGRQARLVEQETETYWVLRALEPRVGDVLDAVVVRPEPRRTHALLVDLAHPFTMPARPDHEAGAAIRVRLRSVRPREQALTVEQV